MDLWPEEFKKPKPVEIPLDIITTQAKLLGEKLNNIVSAEVSSRKVIGSKQDFNYNFYLLSEILDYRYRLFSFSYDISLYPIEFEFAEELVTDESFEDAHILDLNDKDIELEVEEATVKNKEGLITFLKLIFSSKKTMDIINSLYTMSIR